MPRPNGHASLASDLSGHAPVASNGNGHASLAPSQNGRAPAAATSNGDTAAAAEPYGLNGPGRHQTAGGATKEATSPGRFVRRENRGGEAEAHPRSPTAAGSSLRAANEEAARHAHALRELRSVPNPREEPDP
jgi:hypothetical protein